ncbi:50S ribosomal protein L18 [Ehrlichia ruminantium]|uniref:Large ribosomal subunit protein uL18 n=2 Tax=Ehrlichia ruminantium TaxID=779 RepID=RL18_EHRRG|nr:50S ribosomal protein L18 [Ehrlichia ruminantium]Q5FFR4.1 RecName: Full=Large ribosomal subunit protein uL18; AltName: Full=50S ribosomal protein L18 [Ehrlichia ruminantium str. Gardel]Q5HAT8.1 RecName: Full=Large ribosomal subunit protein uL18; AltName: Full=50S ribosomal protein L18 [Ehrlichia ruminantium str. Welgevonden]KYW91392.1 50S ribosomal protein L18 [Ehrlichia ruminantium]QLK50671.1 50S ribosomal protein L18 [Ehrlichia ruminantium]QLK51596.1 50S ribosomal protein L18 [Ehrlichia r
MLATSNRFERRKRRVRLKLKNNLSLLRLSIFKSNRHFYVQLIDDSCGKTYAAASTLEREVIALAHRRVNSNSVKIVAKLMSERLNKLDNCKKFVFDRGPYKYIGVVAEFANELRSYGFEF